MTSRGPFGSIAILGANSTMAGDYLEFTQIPLSCFTLFAREPEAFDRHLYTNVFNYENFNKIGPFDAVINFVGIGSPARAAVENLTVAEVTHRFDEMALSNFGLNPNATYIFISSGAVYQHPTDYFRKLKSSQEIELPNSGKYAYAKWLAEEKHRSLSELNIFDIRVFNYVSARQSINDGFLFTDIARAIVQKGKINN